MPLYEYKCTNCGRVNEFILKFGDAPMDGCRYCGEKRLERVICSAFAVGKGSSPCAMKDVCGDSCGPSPCKFGGCND